MVEPIPLQDLQRTIEDALAQLDGNGADGETEPDRPVEPLPSLLAQCEALCSGAPAPGLGLGLIRSIHHFACSGGTLISKCLATMPNVTLLSEIDPLSRMQTLRPQHPFVPTDLIYNARVARRPIDDAQTIEVFEAALSSLHQTLARRGGYLVLRDHAHSQFCSDTAPAARPTLRDLISRNATALSVVTVRHPLDSWLSLKKKDWLHFTPATLDTYAQRYLSFLDHYEGQEIFYYEDFVTAPDDVLKKICERMHLPFRSGSEDLMSAVRLSGGSGRTSNTISRRPRRTVPDDLFREVEKSEDYLLLCDRLGYDPDPTISAAPDE